MKTIGRNNPCPCGSGLKYKKCCLGDVPWDDFYKHKKVNPILYLSARGKNILFLEAIADALQLNSVKQPRSWSEIKRACTPNAVKKIYEAIPEIWIGRRDLLSVYDRESKHVSGLYVGIYEPEIVFRGITRHCLYSDKILLVDPFLDPRFTRPEYNPIENPNRYRASTLRCLYFWFSLTPWIDSGLINFIRTPGDFDIELKHDCMKVERDKFDSNPEIKALLENDAKEQREDATFEEMKQYYFLCHPDEYMVDWFKKTYPDKSEIDIQQFMKYVNKLRDEHTYYVEFSGVGEENAEMLYWTTGTNYEMAKITARLTGAHIITDIPSRWKEMEIDRQDHGVKDSQWAGFAKAFQNLDFKFLNNVPMNFALKLRKKDRLKQMREFFSRVWKICESKDPLSEKNTNLLAAELNHHINESEVEWKKIDQDLIKWFGVEVASAVAAYPQITSNGGAQFLGAGVAIAGITNLVVSQMKKKSFYNRYPAGFFLSLKKKCKT